MKYLNTPVWFNEQTTVCCFVYFVNMLPSLPCVAPVSPPHVGSASPALECTSKVAGVRGRCTAPAVSAVHWTTLPTAPRGPSCRERSPPYWALVPGQQGLRQLLRLASAQGQELHRRPDQGVEQLEVGTSPSRKRGRRDDDFSDSEDPTSYRQVLPSDRSWPSESTRVQTFRFTSCLTSSL